MRAGRAETKKKGEESESGNCVARLPPPPFPPPLSTMASTLPPEHAPFEALVMSLLSTDNAARTAAEARLADAKAASPDALAAGALAVLRGSGDLAARAFCAVLLRKVLRSGGRGDRGGWWRGGRVGASAAGRWPATAGGERAERKARPGGVDRPRALPFVCAPAGR